jgi:hypothetical protein
MESTLEHYLSPRVTHAMGHTAARTGDQGNVLVSQQDVKTWDVMLALDPRQATTGPDRNRLHTAMGTSVYAPVHTPVDPPTGRRWTPDEDSKLLHAVEVICYEMEDDCDAHSWSNEEAVLE